MSVLQWEEAAERWGKGSRLCGWPPLQALPGGRMESFFLYCGGQQGLVYEDLLHVAGAAPCSQNLTCCRLVAQPTPELPSKGGTGGGCMQCMQCMQMHCTCEEPVDYSVERKVQHPTRVLISRLGRSTVLAMSPDTFDNRLMCSASLFTRCIAMAPRLPFCTLTVGCDMHTTSSNVKKVFYVEATVGLRDHCVRI